MHIITLLFLNFAILIFNKSSAAGRQILSDAFLSDKTITKLSENLSVHPTEIWKLKHRFKTEHDLGINESKLSEFIDCPNNESLGEKLRKVLKGEDVYLTVIGGFTLGGESVPEDNQRGTQEIFPLVIKDWWAEAITSLTGSELNLNLVNISGTGNDFYQYCSQAYLEDNLDLVLVESSGRNLDQLNNVNHSIAVEQLIRQLLLHPQQPALIYVNLHHNTNHLLGCKNLDSDGQKKLSHAYQITSVRWRDLACALTLKNVRKPIAGINRLSEDKHHINLLSHAQVSLMLIDMIRKVLLKITTDKKLAFHSRLLQSLPKPVFIRTNRMITNPLCWTTVSPANDQNTRIKNNLNIKVVKNTMFKFQPVIHACSGSSGFCPTDTYNGWVGTSVGATLIMSFTVPSAASENRANTRSVVLATRTCSYCGKARAWIDNDFENATFINGKLLQPRTLVHIIAVRVNPGIHTLTIRVFEPANVIVAGVMLGPPDGPY